MNRWIIFGSVLCFLAGPPSDLFGQYDPFDGGPNHGGGGADPRVRRANRERAVALVGPTARDFVETYGDEAVAAIFACSGPVALKLAQFHNSGELRKLPRPLGLLNVIAHPGHGDDMALWAIRHARELNDVDSFDAFLFNPLDYALGLRQLETGAAEARARRLSHAATKTRSWAALSADEKLAVAGGVGLLVVGGILLWRRKQSAAC
jgi:hypothetical protein